MARYAVIGTGGIGGYYGGRLSQSGQEVHFLLRSDYEVVRKNGLVVESCNGDFTTVPAGVYNDTKDMPLCDVILVCMKTTANARLAQMLRPVLKPDSVVVMIQNGLGMEERLSKELPGVAIIGATAFICTFKTAPGHIRHAAYGELTLAPFRKKTCEASAEKEGEMMAEVSNDTLNMITSDMESAGIPCHIEPDIALMRWKKLVWNMPYNGMTVAYGLQTDKLTFTPKYRQRVIGIMKEVIEAAAACGTFIPDDFVDKMIANTEVMTPYWPSMYLDYQAHRQMELQTMYAEPIAEALRHGYHMKLSEELYQMLIRISGN